MSACLLHGLLPPLRGLLLPHLSRVFCVALPLNWEEHRHVLAFAGGGGDEAPASKARCAKGSSVRLYVSEETPSKVLVQACLRMLCVGRALQWLPEIGRSETRSPSAATRGAAAVGPLHPHPSRARTRSRYRWQRVARRRLLPSHRQPPVLLQFPSSCSSSPSTAAATPRGCRCFGWLLLATLRPSSYGIANAPVSKAVLPLSA